MVRVVAFEEEFGMVRDSGRGRRGIRGDSICFMIIE